jgi:hypothetical protein
MNVSEKFMQNAFFVYNFKTESVKCTITAAGEKVLKTWQNLIQHASC